MSFSSSKNSSNLEKYYYNNIYKSSSERRTKPKTPSTLAVSGANKYYTKSLYSSSSPQSGREPDQTETESIISSIRRLGIESPSFSSVQNLRNQSYLQSRDHDCIETLLLQMEPTKEEPGELASEIKPIVIDDVVPEVLVEVETKPTRSKFVKFFHRSRELFRTAGTRCLAWLTLLKKLAVLVGPIDFQSKFYIFWLALVSGAFIYNLISITLRYSFGLDFNPEGFVLDLDVRNNASVFLRVTNFTEKLDKIKWMVVWLRENRFAVWLICDLVADFIYLVDIFLVQTRIKFIREGLWVIDVKSTALKYLKSPKFIVIFCLFCGIFTVNRI